MLTKLALVTTAAALAAGPAAGTALADGTPSTPTPQPPVVKGAVRIYLRDAFFIHGDAVTVPGRPMTFQGVVRPYVPGQRVRVRVVLGRRSIKRQTVRIRPSGNQSYGTFTVRVAGPAPGTLRLSVTHAATRQMLGFAGRRAVAILGEHVGFGSRGRFVQLLQQRLSARRIYVPQTGVYDQQTGLAVDAYHRLLGWGFSQSLGGATVSALLDDRGAFHVRYPRDGKHVEGNLGKQLLALTYGSRVYRIYPISSGKPSTPTITGHFRVYMRTPGYLPDGMYYSSFFHGGYAIHGYNPAPDYPASHGCMRLPIIDAISVYDWLKYGDVVDVYH